MSSPAIVELDPLVEFFDVLQNKMTRKYYTLRLELFFEKIQIEGSNLREKSRAFVRQAKADPTWATFKINEWMRFQKQRAENGEIEESTIPNFYKPIKLFCEQNDIILNFKKISRRFPKGRSFANDRSPTRDEIKKILTYPDRRIKVAVLLMVSASPRVGVFHYTAGSKEDYLRLKDVTPIMRDGKVVAAKVVIYRGDRAQDFCFASPEWYNSLEEYVEHRKNSGERISPESPVLRDLFYPDKGYKGEPHLPRQMTMRGVKDMVEKAERFTGVRPEKLPNGQKRYEFQADHGFRKFFKTTAEKHMKSLYVEILMNHSTGLGDNYERPPEKELLDEYLKAVPDLTITEEVGLRKVEEKVDKSTQNLEERMKRMEEHFKVVYDASPEELAQAIEEARRNRIKQAELEQLKAQDENPNPPLTKEEIERASRLLK